MCPAQNKAMIVANRRLLPDAGLGSATWSAIDRHQTQQSTPKTKMSPGTSSLLSQFLASSLRTEVADSSQALVPIADFPHS